MVGRAGYKISKTNVLSHDEFQRQRTNLTVKETADSRGRVYGSIKVEARRTGSRLAISVNSPLLSAHASKRAEERKVKLLQTTARGEGGETNIHQDHPLSIFI